VLEYPLAECSNGQQLRLDYVDDLRMKDYRKFYTLPEESIASAALSQKDSGCRLRLSWDSSVAPYLGVWVDERTYSSETTVALEPASGYYDSLALAVANKRVSMLAPSGVAIWWLAAECGPALCG
jgi:hypothetical protein